MSATLQWALMRSSPHTHTTATHSQGSVTHTSVTCTNITVTHARKGHCGAGHDLAGWPWAWLTVAVCRYVQHYGLGEACDDVASVLKRVAVRLGKTRKVKVLTGTGETGRGAPAVGRLGCGGEHRGDMRLSWERRFLSSLHAAGLGMLGAPVSTPSSPALGESLCFLSEQALGSKLHRYPP